MHPVLLKTPYFTIYSYGLCMAFAVLLAWLISTRLARRLSGQQTDVSYSATRAADLLFIFFIAGIAGARLFYALQHPSEFTGRWIAVFFFQEGGLVFYGGLIAGVACGVIYMRLRRIPVFPWADLFSPVLVLSQAVGRVGCYLNGCCFGRNGHAVQLYEASFLIVFSIFLFIRLFRQKMHGEVFVLYLIGYGSARFALEFFRGDQTSYAGMTSPQWVSLCLVAFGIGLYGYLRRSYR